MRAPHRLITSHYHSLSLLFITPSVNYYHQPFTGLLWLLVANGAPTSGAGKRFFRTLSVPLRSQQRYYLYCHAARPTPPPTRARSYYSSRSRSPRCVSVKPLFYVKFPHSPSRQICASVVMAMSFQRAISCLLPVRGRRSATSLSAAPGTFTSSSPRGTRRAGRACVPVRLPS